MSSKDAFGHLEIVKVRKKNRSYFKKQRVGNISGFYLLIFKEERDRRGINYLFFGKKKRMVEHKIIKY